MATITTGAIPKITERSVRELIEFGERDHLPDIQKWAERKHTIPACARLTVTKDSVWGATELYWRWFEVTL
ncbi:MAG: hypothetical protein M0R66_02100 [Candidatus Omnitrophica bacterium]|jgi:hypothetical protein|nr:hypothetical protein [Candidatus Omnitrophota bacterium]